METHHFIGVFAYFSLLKHFSKVEPGALIYKFHTAAPTTVWTGESHCRWWTVTILDAFSALFGLLRMLNLNDRMINWNERMLNWANLLHVQCIGLGLTREESFEIFVMFLNPSWTVLAVWLGTLSCWKSTLPLGNTVTMKGWTWCTTLFRKLEQVSVTSTSTWMSEHCPGTLPRASHYLHWLTFFL